MELILYIIIGFIAQMIDGMLGMGYGVSCRTFLTTFVHIPYNISSALVHYAEIPSSFTSMIFHFKWKNVNKNIFIKLITTGTISSIIGAYIIFLDFKWLELIVDIYLFIIGIIILSKSFNNKKQKNKTMPKIYTYILGFLGGFFDAGGGGGYGPIVTGGLLLNSDNHKKIIGTVNASEFFITMSSSMTFILFINDVKKHLIIVIGLIIGGVVASPIATKICMKLEDQKLYFLTGLMLVILNIYNITNFVIK